MAAEDDFPTLGAAPVKKQEAQQPKGKKQKGKKMALDDFLGESAAGGSWADEMDSLPSGPSARESGNVDSFGRGGGRPVGRADRQDWERPSFDRPEVPLPTAPPYTAYVGNLSYETTEGDLEDFFAPRPLSSTRIVTGHDGKPKGFAYVEFTELEDLKSSLTLDGTSLVERRVRVSVAEPPRERDDRTDREWRRDGPLPSLGDDRRGGGSRFSDRPPVEDSDWTSARGGRFQPTEDVQPRGSGMRRDFTGGAPPFQRPAGSGGFESGNFERGSKFVPSASSPSSEQQQSEGPRKSFSPAAPVGEADNASTWRRAAPVPSQSPPQSASFERPSVSSTSPPPSAAPAQRKKLELQPRSTSSGSISAPQASPSTKPSPFGAAAPVNTAERERQIEAKRAEARAQAEKERAAAAEKKAATSANGAPTSPPADNRAWRRAAPAPSARSPEPQSATSPPPGATVGKGRQPSGSGPQGEKAMRKEGFSFASAAAAKAMQEAGEDAA